MKSADPGAARLWELKCHCVDMEHNQRSGLASPLLDAEKESRKTDPQLVLHCTMGIVAFVSFILAADPADAMYRAAVVCDVPPTPERDSVLWSGSALCGDRSAVLAVGQRIAGDLNCISLFAHLVGGPPIAAIADAVGRTHALLVSAALQTSCRLLILAAVGWTATNSAIYSGNNATDSTASISFGMPLSLLITARVLGGLSSFNIPANALVGDVTPEAARGLAFSKVAIALAVASALGHLGQVHTLVHMARACKSKWTDRSH